MDNPIESAVSRGGEVGELIAKNWPLRVTLQLAIEKSGVGKPTNKPFDGGLGSPEFASYAQRNLGLSPVNDGKIEFPGGSNK